VLTTVVTEWTRYHFAQAGERALRKHGDMFFKTLKQFDILNRKTILLVVLQSWQRYCQDERQHSTRSNIVSRFAQMANHHNRVVAATVMAVNRAEDESLLHVIITRWSCLVVEENDMDVQAANLATQLRDREAYRGRTRRLMDVINRNLHFGLGRQYAARWRAEVVLIQDARRERFAKKAHILRLANESIGKLACSSLKNFLLGWQNVVATSKAELLMNQAVFRSRNLIDHVCLAWGDAEHEQLIRVIFARWSRATAEERELCCRDVFMSREQAVCFRRVQAVSALGRSRVGSFLQDCVSS
jgi:hypothetical protein